MQKMWVGDKIENWGARVFSSLVFNILIYCAIWSSLPVNSKVFSVKSLYRIPFTALKETRNYCQTLLLFMMQIMPFSLISIPHLSIQKNYYNRCHAAIVVQKSVISNNVISFEKFSIGESGTFPFNSIA